MLRVSANLAGDTVDLTALTGKLLLPKDAGRSDMAPCCSRFADAVMSRDPVDP